MSPELNGTTRMGESFKAVSTFSKRFAAFAFLFMPAQEEAKASSSSSNSGIP